MYLSDLSQRIVIIVLPGPSSCPNFIAPATLTPLLIPKLKPSFWIKSNIIGKDSLSSIEKAPSIVAVAKFFVTLLEPIPSAIDPPSLFN